LKGDLTALLVEGAFRDVKLKSSPKDY
jgi:hypothetical protein